MKDSTNKIKILKTLLESPKTTGQIAIALDYIDNKGHGIYKNISSDLEKLEGKGFIHKIKSKKTVGAPAKTYDINYDISVLRELFKDLQEYSSLILVLQKNKRIVSMVADKQNLFAKHPIDSSELETAKKMLTLSWSFFKSYVLKSNFLDTFCELWLEAHHEEMEKGNITLDYKAGTDYVNGEKWVSCRLTSPIFEILFNAFEHSIITDRIDGVYNPKSFDYLKTINKLYFYLRLSSPG